MTLKEKLSTIDKQFDYVIVDTSPGWDPLIVNVLFYVQEVLTPVSLEVMTLQGLVEFLKSMSSIQKYNKDAGIGTLVATMLPYTFIFMISWAALLILWIILGIPVGPDAPMLLEGK